MSDLAVLRKRHSAQHAAPQTREYVEALEAEVERLRARNDELNHAAEWWAWWMENATPEEKAEYEHR